MLIYMIFYHDTLNKRSSTENCGHLSQEALILPDHSSDVPSTSIVTDVKVKRVNVRDS